jgi:putative PIN family toxin of toxin-antitoxin system
MTVESGIERFASMMSSPCYLWPTLPLVYTSPGVVKATQRGLTGSLGISYDTAVRRVVLDTSVIVAALRSRQGASFRLVSLLEQGRYEIALSVPLLFEYEDVLTRFVETGLYESRDVDDFLDFVCHVAFRQSIFFLWRPYLPDAKDDMVLELAVAAGSEAIITHNVRDFVGTKNFGIEVHRPKDFLHILEEAS